MPNLGAVGVDFKGNYGKIHLFRKISTRGGRLLSICSQNEPLMASPLKQNDPPEKNTPDFAGLVADHQPRLCAYIRSLIGDEHASKDILQEANITMLRKSKDFTLGTNFTAWSFRIAYFEVLTWRRRLGRSRLHFDDELVESLASVIEEVAPGYDQRLDALGHCLRQLPQRQREIIERRYLKSESVQWIAAEMGCNANTASQLLFRARAALLKCILARSPR